MRPVDGPRISGAAARNAVLCLADRLNTAYSGVALADQSVDSVSRLSAVIEHLFLDARKLNPEFVQGFCNRFKTRILGAQKPCSGAENAGPEVGPESLEQFSFEWGHIHEILKVRDAASSAVRGL